MYRVIETSFWTDPKIRAHTKDVKIVAIHLFSNDQSHVSGIYFLRKSSAAEDLSMPLRQYNDCFNKLCNQGFCFWDEDRSVVWVTNMLKRQKAKGANIGKSISLHLESLHETPLIGSFLKYYQHYNIPPPKGVREGDAVLPVPVPVLKSSLNTEQEHGENGKPTKNQQLRKIVESFPEIQKKFPKKNVPEEYEKWTDWMAAKGKTFTSYSASFRNWLRPKQWDPPEDPGSTHASHKYFED